jgi:hypothetical protein
MTDFQRPGIMQMLLAYVVPLSLITPIMLSLVLRQHDKLFIDILPGDRLYILGFILFISQVASVPIMAALVKHTASMVDIRPSFKDAFLIMAVSATPMFVVSVFYLIPSLSFNLVMHGIAALISSALVYLGIKHVFDLQRRGARIILWITVISAASVGFGILLVGALLVWEEIQKLQFAVS